MGADAGFGSNQETTRSEESFLKAHMILELRKDGDATSV